MVVDDLRTVVSEAATNVVLHTYPDGVLRRPLEVNSRRGKEACSSSFAMRERAAAGDAHGIALGRRDFFLLSPPRPRGKGTELLLRLPLQPAFQLTETEPRRGCRTIEVVGELDLAVADRLTEALNRAAEYPLVLVDLGNCDFVDSTGLAAFVHAHNSMKSEGRRFAIFGADHQVLRILSVTGLIEHDLVFESLEAALEADCSEA